MTLYHPNNEFSVSWVCNAHVHIRMRRREVINIYSRYPLIWELILQQLRKIVLRPEILQKGLWECLYISLCGISCPLPPTPSASSALKTPDPVSSFFNIPGRNWRDCRNTKGYPDDPEPASEGVIQMECCHDKSCET